MPGSRGSAPADATASAGTMASAKADAASIAPTIPRNITVMGVARTNIEAPLLFLGCVCFVRTDANYGGNPPRAQPHGSHGVLMINLPSTTGLRSFSVQS